MSPNTRKRKSRLATELQDIVDDWTISSEDQVDVLELLIKKLGISDKLFHNQRKPTRSGRKAIPSATRQNVWKFWHDNSIPSTLTSRPATLRVSDKARIQNELEFVETTTIILKRNQKFYQSHWYIANLTIKELFQKYTLANPESVVSYGSFLAIRPFYVRAATTKDMEMCCCKKHLHARWGIAALLENAKEQGINLNFESYTEFFQHLTEDCTKEKLTYIDLNCTPSKKITCEDITQRWNNLKTDILSKDDKKTTVKFQYFIKEEHVNTKGKTVKRLRAVTTKADLKFITSFISDLLPSIIHHRNQLKHYRSTIHQVYDMFNGAIIDVDFSENLTVPVKYEPQSLHWSHEQVTVHSGIMKFEGEKSYHPYLSDDKKHDQHFVELALHEMISELPTIPETIVIESDNCSQQYKSASHFYSMKQLADKFLFTVIRIYGIAEHGKGEVDHVGGVAKTAIRREVATGTFFESTEEMVEFLEKRFSDSITPRYIPKLICAKKTNQLRDEAKLIQCKSIDGSSSFQVMIFKPNSTIIKAANRLCICDECQSDYGSCALFKEYSLTVCQLQEKLLRSEVEGGEYVSEVEGGEYVSSKSAKDFLLAGSFCAVAADKNSTDTMWFIIINSEESTSKNNESDDYGFCIAAGQPYLKGQFLEKVGNCRAGLKFKVENFFKENVVYPFVNFCKCGDNFYTISDKDYCEVLCYVEHFGVSPI